MSVIDPIADMLAPHSQCVGCGAQHGCRAHSNIKGGDCPDSQRNERFIQDFEAVSAGQSHPVLPHLAQVHG